MLLAVVIGIIISIVVGVALIPMITDTIEEATKDSEDLPEAASALLDALPIVFVVVLILGAVAWIGGSGLSFSSGSSKKKDTSFREEDRIWKALNTSRPSSTPGLLSRIHKEEEKEEEAEVLETPGTLEVPEVPKAPPSSSKPSKKPPWAK